MPKPILLAVDDDTSVLETVVQDLRRHYGEHYRILRAASGPAALDTCKQLLDRKENVALFLSDQRMPGMTGVDFLVQAMPLFPDARRVLLTAYADTEAAIKAINSAKIHYYLNKPWDPPEEKLYPILDDLLESWKTTGTKPFSGIRVIGTRWSADHHKVRDFLARNRVNYQLHEPGDALHLLKEKNLDDSKLPVVMLADGTCLVQPSLTELAERVGLKTEAKQEFYDILVVGAGPAGLAAGVYGSSEGLRTLIVELAAPGGQAGSSSHIENYLGFPQGISGEELAKRAFLQAQRLGAEFVTQRVTCIRTENGYQVATLADGSEVSSHVCLIATGVDWCRLNVPGADKLAGAGVYYGAALTEAISCAKETVYIVGGANSAGQAALHFAKFAAHVHMLVRADSLDKSMSKYLIDQIKSTENITVETNTQILEMRGNEHLESLRLKTPNGEEDRPTTSLFIFIGAAPKTDWLPKEVLRDAKGFILAGNDLKNCAHFKWDLPRDPYLLETSVPGIFVAGDVRHGSVKRAASAVGEGSIAIQFVHQYLAAR